MRAWDAAEEPCVAPAVGLATTLYATFVVVAATSLPSTVWAWWGTASLQARSVRRWRQHLAECDQRRLQYALAPFEHSQ